MPDNRTRAQELASQGYNGAEIAELLGISKQAVSKMRLERTTEPGEDDNIRFRRARADMTEAKARQERLKADEMAGILVRRDAVDKVAESFKRRINTASERIKKLPGGKDGVEIMKEALRGFDAEIESYLEGDA